MQLLNSTTSATGPYWTAQELASLATFVLEDIVPADGPAPPFVPWRGRAVRVVHQVPRLTPLRL
jgi:hypothetical protein